MDKIAMAYMTELIRVVNEDGCTCIQVKTGSISPNGKTLQWKTTKHAAEL